MLGLLLTLGVGLFIIIGALIVFIAKNNSKFIQFAISMAFGVMVTLGILEILPEAYDLINEENTMISTILIVIIFTITGLIILRLLDLFVPDHEHDHEHDKDHQANLYHIGIISTIALLIHNIIEGMAIYNVALNSTKSGLLICLAVGLHNIPLGMIIASSFYKTNKNKKKTMFIISCISFSTFIGGLIMFILSGSSNPLLEGILLCITLGMLIHITVFELLKQIKETKYKYLSIIGIVSGMLLLTISLLI